MRKFALAASCALLVSSLLVTACAPAATPIPIPAPVLSVSTPTVAPATPTPAKPLAEEPRYGGILKTNNREDPTDYDMHQTSTYRIQHPVAPSYSLIVQTDPGDANKVVPDLAETWDVSPDGKVYTFHLRKGVKFHDGKPLTSADVKLSLERLTWPPKRIVPQFKELFENVETITSPDDYTVKIALKRRQASFPLFVAMPFAAIYPKHILDGKGDMKKAIVGTGPFKFKGHLRGVSFEAERNPDYFIKGRPYLDGILRYIMGDFGAIEAALRTGRIDMVLPAQHGIRGPGRRVIEKEIPDMVFVVKAEPTLWGFVGNFKKKPWSDRRVRRAVLLAVDQEELIQIVEQGDGSRGGWMLPGPWSIPQEEVFKMPGFRRPKDQDIAEAKRLLAEAGYPTGFKFSILTRSLPDYANGAIVFKDQLAKIGLEAMVEPLESAAFYARTNAQDFESRSAAIGAAKLPEPDLILNSFYVTGGTNNYGLYSNPAIDELWAKQSETIDPVERKKLIIEMQRILMEDPPGAPYYWRSYSVAYWPRVKNYGFAGLYAGQKFEDVWLAK